MFHSTIVFLCCGFFLLILLRSAPPLIGYRPLLLLSLLSLSPSRSPPPLRHSRPPASSRLLPPHLPSCCYRSSGWGYVILVLGVSLPPPSLPPLPLPPLSSFLLSVGCLSTTSVYLPPLAPSSFPHFPLTLFRLSSPSPSLYPPLLSLSQAPTSGRLLPHMSSPCSEVGCRWSFGFWGCPLYPPPPFTIRDCRISQFCAATCCLLLPPLLYIHPYAWVTSFVFFMSFSWCVFFYCSFFFFSVDSPSHPFVLGATQLYLFVRCGGVVRCLLGLFLALLLFPTSISFLGLLLVSAGFFVCDLLCLFFLRALPVMSLG